MHLYIFCIFEIEIQIEIQIRYDRSTSSGLLKDLQLPATALTTRKLLHLPSARCLTKLKINVLLK